MKNKTLLLLLLTSCFYAKKNQPNSHFIPTGKAIIQTVNLNKLGASMSGKMSKYLITMPLYEIGKDTYYTIIPDRFHADKTLKDTVELLIKVKENNFSNISEYDVSCFDCSNKGWTIDYNKNTHRITITGSNFTQTYALFNTSTRKGNVKKDQIRNTNYQNKEVASWIGIEMICLKYGEIKINNKSFYLSLFDIDRDGIYGKKGYDVISISSQPKYFYVNKTSRSKKINTIKFLDFYGTYFEIKDIDPSGNFIQIKQTKSISPISTIYLDSMIRDNPFVSKNRSYKITDFLEKDKFLLLDLWTEYCPPCIRGIPDLNKFSAKFKDKITIVGLLSDGNKDDLERLKKRYNINYLLGLTNPNITDDIIPFGYPNKILISPSGKIIKRKIRLHEVEKYLEVEK